MKWIALVFCLTFGASVQAQTVNRDAVLGCFHEASIGDTSPLCLGQASNACQQQGFSTTMGIVQCIQAETVIWDDMLNSEYGALRNELRARDTGEISLNDTLRQAQRAWIAYRDPDCEFAYARWQDGSIRSVVYASCIMIKTASRAIELRDMKGN